MKIKFHLITKANKIRYIDPFSITLSFIVFITRSIITRKTWVRCKTIVMRRFILDWSNSNQINKVSLIRSWWIVLVQMRFNILRINIYIHCHSLIGDWLIKICTDKISYRYAEIKFEYIIFILSSKHFHSISLRK